MKAVILAAGIGKRLKGFTRNPKCLIKIKDDPLIIRTIKLLRKFNFKDIVVVVGYRAQQVINELKKHRLKVEIVKNDHFAEGSIISLWKAKHEFGKDILIIDSDLYFQKELIERVTRSKKRNFFLIDTKAKQDNEAVRVGFKGNRAVALARGLNGEYGILGEWAGFLKLSSSGSKKLRQLLEEKISSGKRKIGYEFIIPHLFKKIAISYELIDDLNWIEIDYPGDVAKARNLSID